MHPNNHYILSADPAKTAGAALRTYFNITDAWHLSNSQAMTLLGFDLAKKSTYYSWKRHPEKARLNQDKLERLSYIFGIYENLHTLLPNPESADTWIHRRNMATPFCGHSALKRMLAGHVADLYVVRQYLDAQTQWG